MAPDLCSIDSSEADGALDKARKHKKRQLEDTLNLVIKKRKVIAKPYAHWREFDHIVSGSNVFCNIINNEFVPCSPQLMILEK